MQASDLIAAFRQRADDKVEPYLFSDPDALQWASEGEREACLRAKLLFDDTSALCTIPIAALTPRYPLDPRIVTVDRVWLDRSDLYPGTRKTELRRLDQANTRIGRPDRCDYGNAPYDLATREGARLHGYSIDGETLRLYPLPDASWGTTPFSVLRLEVYRLPLLGMDANPAAPGPEIPEIHHDGLIDWMLYRAYSTQDADSNDPNKAADALALFTQRFGDRPSAKAHRMQQEGRRRTTTYGGY